MKNKIKGIFNNKYIIIGGCVLLVIIISLIIVFTNKKKDDIYTLNEIYDVYPEDVRKMYTNVVDVSCTGDLFLNIDADKGIVNIDKLDKKILMDVLFSYLDKNNLLSDKMSIEELEKYADKLFYTSLDVVNLINDYSYGDYTYSYDKEIVKRKSNKCNSDGRKYVSHLFGYSYNTEELSIDIDFGYLEDGILFDLNNNKLGQYDGNIETLGDMFNVSPHYRYNYVLDGKDYKLKSVGLFNRD